MRLSRVNRTVVVAGLSFGMANNETPAAKVTVDRVGPVTTIMIKRPLARNAVDRETAELLASAFRAFDSDDGASVAVLAGADGNFCAGADLHAFAAGQGNRLAADGDGPMGPTRMTLRKPVIAAVSGYAVAGGLELAVWCDLRVVEESATFGVFCRRWGVPLIDGGTFRLARIVGFGVAMDLILTGRAVDAQEALRIGLASRVVADGTAVAAAQELAATIAELPQECLRNDRVSLYDTWGKSTEDALAVEWRHGMASLESGAAEGAARFASGQGRHGA